MEPLSLFGRFVQNVIESCFFQIHFVSFHRNIQMTAVMLQTIPRFTQIFQKKVSLFLQIHMKNTLFVGTTASPITTTTCVFHPFVTIIIYYLERLKSYKRSWINFASPINTWIVCIHYSSVDSVENLMQRVDKRLITCNEQLIFITETGELTGCRALR